MDGESTTKRMNIGRMYEHRFNAHSRQLSHEIRDQLHREEFSQEAIDHCWKRLLRYYELLSPKQYEHSLHIDSFEHLKEISRNGIYLFLPTDNPVDYSEVALALQKEFPLNIGPVTYIGRSGVQCTTINDVLIGEMYVMLLEKTGNDWSGVSSSKLQHFGVPAKLTNSDKYSAPGRAQPIRFIGESEGRLMVSFADPEVTADIIDQSNNPAVHKEIVKNILTADKPSRIDEIIDRDKFPVGKGRPLTFIRHMLQCQGVNIVTPPRYKK